MDRKEGLTGFRFGCLLGERKRFSALLRSAQFLFGTFPIFPEFSPQLGPRKVSNGEVSRSGLVLPFLVLFGTFPIFPRFPRFVRGLFGIFPICPFPLSRPINSAYEEQSRRVRDTIRTSPETSRKPPGLETPGLASPSGRSNRDFSTPESHFWVIFLGKRKRTPPCSSAELFFAEKKWGPQRKDLSGRYGFPGSS